MARRRPSENNNSENNDIVLDIAAARVYGRGVYVYACSCDSRQTGRGAEQAPKHRFLVVEQR